MTLTTSSALRKDTAMPSGNSMQHRHFATVANILQRRFVKTPHHVRSALDICEVFADELAATNPKFNRARFMRACGLE